VSVLRKATSAVLSSALRAKARFGMLGEIRIERGGAMQGAVVVIDDLFERGKTTVVHVGRGECHVAQRRNLELVPVRFGLGGFHVARIVRVGLEAVVDELMIAKEVPAMAMEAIRAAQAALRIVFSDEKLEAALLLFRQLGKISRGAIKLRFLRDERQEELLQREGDSVSGDFRRTKGRIERGAVGGVLAELGGHALQRFVHLMRVLNRKQHLVAQRFRAAVPEKLLRPREIHQRHRVATTALAALAQAERTTVSERLRLFVAAGARLRVVPGQAWFVEEAATQRDAFDSERIVRWQVHFGQALRDVKAVGSGAGRKRTDDVGRRLDRLIEIDLNTKHAERFGRAFHQRPGQRITVAGVRGGGFFENIAAIENGRDIESDSNGRGSCAGELYGQFDHHRLIGSSEVIRIAAGSTGGGRPVAFQREEDVAGPPAPVESAHVGMERMFSWPFLRIAGVELCVEPDAETNGFELLCGESVCAGRESTFFHAEEHEPVTGFQPRAVGALEGELREQSVEPADGEVVCLRECEWAGQLERRVAPARFNFNPQLLRWRRQREEHQGKAERVR
jgi:hypothetical protein